MTDSVGLESHHPFMISHSDVVLSEQTLLRICAEFIEMPGLRLTFGQAQRLWGLDERTCAASLAFLVNAKFLTCVGDRVYARLTDGRTPVQTLRMAKVDALTPYPAASVADGPSRALRASSRPKSSRAS